MSKKLDDIRKKIDALDDKIHDLLMQRADLIVDIAEEKRKRSLQVVHPDREARMIRRLLKRHHGPLPESAVLSIWRELVGAVCMMQTGLKVVVAENDDFHEHWDMAKNYFGSVLHINKVSSPLMAVAAVRDNEASFAVLPWPLEGLDASDVMPWWAYLFNGDEKMRIVCALPYGYEKGNFMNTEPKAMVISKIEFLDSGDDHSCIGLEVDSTVSRAKIIEQFKKHKLEPIGLYTKSGMNTTELSLHMVVVNQFVAADDPKLKALESAFEEDRGKCKALGGYPVPPLMKPVVRNV